MYVHTIVIYFYHYQVCVRLYSSKLSQEVKQQLADGPDLADFIRGDVEKYKSYSGDLKKKQGQR